MSVRWGPTSPTAPFVWPISSRAASGPLIACHGRASRQVPLATTYSCHPCALPVATSICATAIAPPPHPPEHPSLIQCSERTVPPLSPLANLRPHRNGRCDDAWRVPALPCAFVAQIAQTVVCVAATAGAAAFAPPLRQNRYLPHRLRRHTQTHPHPSSPPPDPSTPPPHLRRQGPLRCHLLPSQPARLAYSLRMGNAEQNLPEHHRPPPAPFAHIRGMCGVSRRASSRCRDLLYAQIFDRKGNVSSWRTTA